MATKADLEGALTKIGGSLTNISADIKNLAGQVGAGGLSQADLDEIAGKLNAIADTAEALAAITPDAPIEPPVTQSA